MAIFIEGHGDFHRRPWRFPCDPMAIFIEGHGDFHTRQLLLVEFEALQARVAEYIDSFILPIFHCFHFFLARVY